MVSAQSAKALIQFSMHSILLVLTVVTLASLATAQPAGQDQGATPPSSLAVTKMPAQDNGVLREKYRDRRSKGLPIRFAEPIRLAAKPDNSGQWETLKDGSRLWRLRISSPGAMTLNLGFTTYVMPPGGFMFIYSPAGESVGPFTVLDNDDHQQLWTPMIVGDEIIVEVGLPADEESQLKLELTRVNHGFLDTKSGDKSGSCNVDVVCPEGDLWRSQIRSVGAITISGVDTCTGALINNTAQDLTPYFLTADHCSISASNAPQVVVYWNYENSTCRPPGSPASGVAGDGSRLEFNSGAIFRADYSPSDMTLIEFDDPIAPAHNLFWAGWDRTSGDFSGAIAIHHPAVEEKRISFENDPTATTSYSGSSNPGDGTHVRIIDWDLGTTEGGSSGSPLFSPAGRIVGQLHGGGAACGNDESDWYGRLSVSWIGGGSAATRLQDWLDPGNTGVTTLDGRDIAPDFSLAFNNNSVNVCQPSNAQFTVNVGSMVGYTDPVTLSAPTLPAGVTAGFSVNPVTPPGSSVMTISGTGSAAVGSHAIAVQGVGSTGPKTINGTLAIFSGAPGAIALTAPAAGATDVSRVPTLSWAANPNIASHRIEVATDAAFNNIAFTADLPAPASSYGPPSILPANTQYFWHVRGENACGIGAYSGARSFTTGDFTFSTPNLPIPDDNPTGISDSIVVSSTRNLLDLDVYLDITHTWVGDLSITLRHVETGTVIDLLSRLTGFGCDGENIDAALSDGPYPLIHDTCGGSDPAMGGLLSPSTPLSAFVGETWNGTWTLRVVDNAGLDLGTLHQWGLFPTFPPSPPPGLTGANRAWMMY